MDRSIRKHSLQVGLEGFRNFLSALGVDAHDVSDETTLAEAAKIVAQVLVAGRTHWTDRAHHENLRHLKNAPQFLREVYGDLIESDLRLPDGRIIWHLRLKDGRLVWQEAVRFNDPTLVQVMQDYANKKEQRSARSDFSTLGDAEGLAFEKTTSRGRPRKPSKAKKVQSKHSLGS